MWMYGIPETTGINPTIAEPAAIPPETDEETMMAKRTKKQARIPQTTDITSVGIAGIGNSANMIYAANEPTRNMPRRVNL